MARRRCWPRAGRAELAAREREDLDDARGDGPEDEEEPALEEAADPARLDEPVRDQDHRCLDQDVPVACVGKLVGENPFQLPGLSSVTRPCVRAIPEDLPGLRRARVGGRPG